VSSPRYLLLFDSYGLLFFLWGALSDERTGLSFVYDGWPLTAQSFSGSSPLVLTTIFSCLRFETSLFVASYDSQGHGGGIRPRLHTGIQLSLAVLGLSKSSPDRIRDTVRQGSISRVQQSVASETLLIDNGNVFRLSRCYSMERRR
jgi:hypothetical protein